MASKKLAWPRLPPSSTDSIKMHFHSLQICSASKKNRAMDIKESDWKILREVREAALQRFCDRILSEVSELASDTSKSSHERYLTIYDLIHDCNKKMAAAFDGPRRSVALIQLGSMHALDLLTKEEIGRFSPGTQQSLEFFEKNR